MQRLLSLPPRMAREFGVLEPERAGEWFVGCDPPGRPLGSGGGTWHLLREAWRATGGEATFAEWLRQSPKLVVHAGGESRRLPAYAVTGKALIPMPVIRGSHGQRLDQTLLDLQQAGYERMLAQAPPGYRVMVTSGDVLVRCAARLPRLPAVDVLALGLWVRPELASQHGVFFCPRRAPEQLAFFLQKPSPAHVRELGRDHLFLVDVGVWLLSERALEVLAGKCGEPVRRYELYGEFGLGLGARPAREDAGVNGLRAAVVPLPAGEFYHFGTSRTLIESVTALHNAAVDQTRWGGGAVTLHPDVHLQNCRYEVARTAQQTTIWVENAHVPATWELSREHVLTGVPDNDWSVRLEPGVCLDFVPVGNEEWCLRFYRLDEPEVPARWFAARNLEVQAPYPVLPRAEWSGEFIEWLTSATPAPSTKWAERWQRARRLTAAELLQAADLAALAAQRRRNRERILEPLARNCRQSVFYRLDLEATARLYAATGGELPAAEAMGDPLGEARAAMFRAAVLRARGRDGVAAEEARAFGVLRDWVVREMERQPVRPAGRLLEDQIVWGRSPVRLDLAGGWTDTPPYCLQFGGAVVNVAVDLNGQPPIQVFGRVCERPELVIRSIDLGLEERVTTYEQLASFAQVGSGFAIAKAALALAGFLPRFGGDGSGTLAEQLRRFGGGLEVSLLSAVPKGSGLGTSSILAATLLGTLGEMCGLNWSERDLFRRTLALEQLLTTGGGWQDQVGGVLPGLKLVETEPGLEQTPTVRWLPAELLADERVLLYYTGLTRVAADILREIVRRMFLNERRTLAVLEQIGEHARATADALQRRDRAEFAEAVARSWQLNQELDAGTNPPSVQAILDAVAGDVAGAKLLGAGGGGFLLLVARDAEAARRIRERLTERPPNARARFVQPSVSVSGFQVTRS